ncbi:Putative transposase (identified by ISEscan HMM) [Escherichia coli]|nr:Putative transposase (identified by ISEscan HMM) [Escherichia coli]
MPRRLILSATERDTRAAGKPDDLIRYYTFNDSDLSLIRQRRGDANRLGFAVQLCLLRYPGYALGTDSELPEPVILGGEASPSRAGELGKYGERDVTRREHAENCAPTCNWFGLSDFRAGARANRAGPADRQRLAAGRSGPGEPTAETTHPAGAERD